MRHFDERVFYETYTIKYHWQSFKLFDMNLLFPKPNGHQEA